MENLKGAQTTRQILALTATAMMVCLMFTTLFPVHAQEATEYERFVHTYINSNKGNWTSVEKPMFPVYFNDTQIPIGGKWSVVCPLVASHSYHVYCFGDWVADNSAPDTDYDIFVYNPRGILESEHTRAAGLPEHIGTNANGTFFEPAMSGNYTFVINNDARQSNNTQAATFMVIENIECDTWQKRSFEGNGQNSLSTISTSWAYEFVTDKPQIEVYLKVPATLDMYEIRLYAMSDPSSVMVNDAPLPWEPGLYGNVSGVSGGYSLDGGSYRGVAYASCEYRGQQMHLNYTSPTSGKTLYHLVLIAESGSGNVEFLVKTKFDTNSLSPSVAIGKAFPWNETLIAYASNSTTLENAILDYTTNAWISKHSVEMAVENRTCSTLIPQQKAGTTVEYRIAANDTLMNALTAAGVFSVKLPSTLNITLATEDVRTGDNAAINGKLVGLNDTGIVTLTFLSSNDTATVDCLTLEDGTFTTIFNPNSTGVWGVQAQFAGTTTYYPSISNMLTVDVQEPSFYAKNGIFVGGGFLGAVAILATVAYMRKRRQ